jgi:hypothetical protein
MSRSSTLNLVLVPACGQQKGLLTESDDALGAHAVLGRPTLPQVVWRTTLRGTRRGIRLRIRSWRRRRPVDPVWQGFFGGLGGGTGRVVLAFLEGYLFV